MEPISIVLASLNIETLTPMMIAIVGALIILIVDLVKPDLNKSLYVMLTILILFLDFGVLTDFVSVFMENGTVLGFFDLLLLDGLSVLSQMVIVGSSMLFIMLALSSKRFHEYDYGEYFALFLFMVAGYQFMVATDNLILIFLGLETSSLALYALIAMHNRSKSFEAAIKYFTMGALGAGFYVFGAMVFYALTGSLEISQIAVILQADGFQKIGYILVAIVFMLAAFGFKLSMVPFHTWTPDVYEGSTSALAGYMSVVPKIAAFTVAIRLFEFLVNSGIVWLESVLWVVVVLTMTAANIWALVQTDIKRMLAYSSISHAGFVMAAVLIGTTQSNTGMFLYWVMFAFANLGSFTMLWVNRQKDLLPGQSSDHPYEKFSGLIQTMPMAAVLMALFMFTLAGIPPFGVFWGKLYLIGSAVTADYPVLALIMALNSAIAAYYYLKLVIYMFMKDPYVSQKNFYMLNATLPLKTMIGIATIGAIFSVFAVQPLLEFFSVMLYNSGY